jgi:predicted RNA-binding Zn-ribbon protein involved in translation (DUF1610 family)
MSITGIIKKHFHKKQGELMLSINKTTHIPLCPQCARELKELTVETTNVKYYEFDTHDLLYNPIEITKVKDKNVFNCPECGADIKVKDILETLTYLSRLNHR